MRWCAFFTLFQGRVRSSIRLSARLCNLSFHFLYEFNLLFSMKRRFIRVIGLPMLLLFFTFVWGANRAKTFVSFYDRLAYQFLFFEIYHSSSAYRKGEHRSKVSFWNYQPNDWLCGGTCRAGGETIGSIFSTNPTLWRSNRIGTIHGTITLVTYEARKACLHQAFRASFTLAASISLRGIDAGIHINDMVPVTMHFCFSKRILQQAEG